MTHAIEVAALVGADVVDRALGLAAIAGRFDDDDLVSIIERQRVDDVGWTAATVADQSQSTQPGTAAWEALR